MEATQRSHGSASLAASAVCLVASAALIVLRLLTWPSFSDSQEPFSVRAAELAWALGLAIIGLALAGIGSASAGTRFKVLFVGNLAAAIIAAALTFNMLRYYTVFSG